MGKIIIGSFLVPIGLLLTFTGVGAVVGVPMFIGGLIAGATGFASLGKGAVKTGMLVGKIARERNAAREEEATTFIEAEPKAPASSIADEIGKLGELKNAGLLTEDEFTRKKTQLLGL